MLIFLDIDGVMVPAKGWKSPTLLNDGFPAFSNMAVLVLKQLINEDTTIILTTSHKSRFSIDEWKSIFFKRDLPLNNLKTLGDNIQSLNRKDELLNWFNLNDISEAFIIIDDDKSLNDLPTFLKDRLVLTSPLIGLTEQHLEEINSILSQNPYIA